MHLAVSVSSMRILGVSMRLPEKRKGPSEPIPKPKPKRKPKPSEHSESEEEHVTTEGESDKPDDDVPRYLMVT